MTEGVLNHQNKTGKSVYLYISDI